MTAQTSQLRPKPTNHVAHAKNTHGGRRTGAGAPKGNMNAFRHGLWAERYDKRLLDSSHAKNHRLLAQLHRMARMYRQENLSRRQRRDLTLHAGLIVLSTWYALCHAIWVEQSRS